jgi:hypothetical protein
MATIQSQQIGSKVLTNDTLTIVAEDGIQVVSMVLMSGNGTFTGTLTIQGVPADPIPLEKKAPITISSDGGRPLDGVVISCPSGVVDVIFKN